MSEVRITIRFQCQPEHSEHWQVVCELLDQGKLGWQLQDAIDPISVPAADALDEVWDKLNALGITPESSHYILSGFGQIKDLLKSKGFDIVEEADDILEGLD